MNGFQQRTHRSQRDQQVGDMVKILQELDERIVELARIVELLDKRTVELGQGTADAYNALSATVTRLETSSTERWLLCLEAQGRFFDALAAHASRSLWQRLRWMLVGR
jgi:hypothetical protein